MDEETRVAAVAVRVDQLELEQSAGWVEVGVVVEGGEGGVGVHAVAEGEVAVGLVGWGWGGEVP